MQISAGNTGALMALSMFILRKVEGVHRPALVGSWPTRKGVCAMLDLGADIVADAEQLVEFAIMGAAFSRAVHGVQNPRVALLNIGEEELKGHESIREAARLIRASNLSIDFRGFIEADKIGSGNVDVWKRNRLMGVGADVVVPDYRDADALLNTILGK